jgi:peptidyl-prolyl cis-trans isomerase SurA
MNKKWLTAMSLCCITMAASSQTLFTYGTHKADAKEFVRAFNKNNQQPGNKKEKAMRDYMELYVNSRLKIQEAYDRGYDTLPQIKSEVENLRSQIIENYMSNPEAIDKLTKQAFQRSLKDIHLAHIYISFRNPQGFPDSATAKQKLAEVTRRLAKGEDFLMVAQQLSDDPSAKINKGDLNYITVFTLPYEFENIAYSITPGKNSKAYASKTGYHIFKNLGERKALGKIKVQQILLAFPPGADEAAKKNIGRQADSLYNRIIKGEDFSKLAAAYSHDFVSASAEGNVPDISVGQYDADFEKALWSLPNDAAVSKPFTSSHGYHIVKRIAVKPVVTNSTDKANNELLQQKIMADDRWKTIKDFIYTKVKAKAGFQKSPYADAALWGISDSLLDFKAAGIGRSMTEKSPLFKIGKNSYTIKEWIEYAQAYRFKPDRSGLKAYPDLLDEFIKQSMYQYYRENLEDFNAEFKNQMAEFKEGNLFFEIMQQEVWNKAQADSGALLALFEKNNPKYDWKQSADAVIFFCTEVATAKLLAEQLKKSPADWKKTAEVLSEKVVADSSRYEWSQIPGIGNTIPKAGTITEIAVNPSDNTASFAYIRTVYTQPSSRSFTEAKGLVMNDYQQQLEDEWMKRLKKKYPITVDQKVLNSIAK